jgi:hypothetical protein
MERFYINREKERAIHKTLPLSLRPDPPIGYGAEKSFDVKDRGP